MSDTYIYIPTGSHDPLCPALHTCNCTLCDPYCACDILAQARADEREEVIDRQKIAMFADFRTNANGKLILYWETAEAAARGKELQ